ncbi:MAG: esterase family protein [Lentisphaerae bacterium]|nr:esterase family protein [Lentisphaerota bacterium]
MALFHSNFYSDVLGMQSSADVILPDRPDPARKMPTLYLLHGLSDDHTIWQRRTSIERYASKYYLAIVMPNGHRSFYTDMKSGRAYFTYISEELPNLMETFFPLSGERSERFIAGLSMGGYGAFKIAINLPGRYAAGAALSAVFNVNRREQSPEFKAIFGDGVSGTPDDMYASVDKLIAETPEEKLPKLYQFCGTEDHLYGDNQEFREYSAKAGLPIEYSEGSGGHSWDVWDEQIKHVLEWLPLCTEAKRTTAIG